MKHRIKSIFNYRLIMLVLCVFTVATLSPVADAAEKKDKAARKAALMMQKMKQDMEALQSQFDTEKKAFEDKLKTKDEELVSVTSMLNKAEKKNKNLESENVKLSNEKAALEIKLQQTQAELEVTQKNLADLNILHKQALADLKFNDNQRKTLSTNLADTTKSVNECTEKNTKLHQFGTDLIKLYDKPSAYEAAMRKEKFFQLKRVELENILQGKQDSLDEAKFTNHKSAY